MRHKKTVTFSLLYIWSLSSIVILAPHLGPPAVEKTAATVKTPPAAKNTRPPLTAVKAGPVVNSSPASHAKSSSAIKIRKSQVVSRGEAKPVTTAAKPAVQGKKAKIELKAEEPDPFIGGAVVISQLDEGKTEKSVPEPPLKLYEWVDSVRKGAFPGFSVSESGL